MPQKQALPPVLLDVYNKAVRHHGAGRLADAERGYRQLLATYPAHADSLHLLGVIGYQAGQHEASVALIRKAIEINERDPSYHCNLGLILQAIDRLDEAGAAYQQALALKPDHPEAHNNLGNLLLATGQTEEAASHYRQALALRPRDAQTHTNLGLALHTLGRREEAEASYRQALAHAPNLADAHQNLANLLQATGRLDEAATHYRNALEARPNDPQVHNNLANTLQAMGRTNEAITSYRQALTLNPGYVEAHNNLGNVLQALGRLDEAVTCYTHALAIRPEYVEAHNNLGNALQALGRLDAAVGCYEAALQLKPDYAEAHNNLGRVLEVLGRLDEAMVRYTHALAIRPEYAEAHCNFGNALLALGRLEEALARYGQTLAIQPELAEAHLGVGNVLQALGRGEEAEARYALLLERKPDYAQAHLNHAFAQLRNGNFAAGWRSHEWRWRLEGHASPKLDFSAPQWDGSPLNGARILLHCEQGLGDSLQFLRYLPMVQAAGGTVILQVPPSLRGLASGLSGVSEIVLFGEPWPIHEWHCPLMSLPLALGTTLGSIPAAVPYLRVSEEAHGRARTYPWPAKGLRVGLVWAGNAKHGNDRFRSIALSLLLPILQIEEIAFLSLQLGQSSSQLASIEANIADLAPAISDLEDTAALIAQLDLVIAVDTAVAHLTGALGKPLWLLLPANADWRWLVEREDSPWYPTARLFRQDKLGDWTDVVQRVADSLRKLRPANG